MEPKFKKGDNVWFKSNWFAGSYIPDTFEVFDIREQDSKYQYRKKRMRTWWDEDKLFATEEECQIHEMNRFVADKKKQIEDLLTKSRNLGIEQKAKKALTSSVLYLPKDGDNNEALYKVGDKVWGSLYKHLGNDDYANPQEYIISEVLQASDDEGNTWYVYHVKGHGTLVVDENNLYPTLEDALLGHATILRRDAIDVINALKERCSRLGITTNNLLAIESKIQS